MMLCTSSDFVRLLTVESVEKFNSIPQMTFVNFGNGELECDLEEYTGEMYLRVSQIESVEDAGHGCYLPDCEYQSASLVRVRTASGREILAITFSDSLEEIDLNYFL